MKYHSVLLPLPDTYSLSGRQVFQELQRTKDDGKKNAIILPGSLIDKIESKGVEDALIFIVKENDAKEKGSRLIYQLSEGLDVIYLKDLEIELIKKDFPDLKVITTDARKTLEWKARGFDVEKPGFLVADAYTTTQGIITGSVDLQAKLYENKGKISLEEVSSLIGKKPFINQFFSFGKDYGVVEGTIERNKDGSRIVGVKDENLRLLNKEEYNRDLFIGKQRKQNLFGISPLDIEQYLAMQYGILNPNVEVCFICGSHGSGKTLISYVSAVDLILNYPKKEASLRGHGDRNQMFRQIALLKPNELIGGNRRSEGFLPGNLWEKMRPHLQSFIDSHKLSDLDEFAFKEMILHPKRANEFGDQRSINLKDKKFNGAYLPPGNEAILIEPASYFRGRSLSNTLLFVDEAQNFTPGEMKNIMSRVGVGSKIIVVGDPDQVDNPYCSKDINGLTASIKHFFGKPYVSLISLSRNRRSQASEDALGWNIY